MANMSAPIRYRDFNPVRRKVEDLENLIQEQNKKIEELFAKFAAIEEAEKQAELNREPTYEEMVAKLEEAGAEYDKRVKDITKLKTILEEHNAQTE